MTVICLFTVLFFEKNAYASTINELLEFVESYSDFQRDSFDLGMQALSNENDFRFNLTWNQKKAVYQYMDDTKKRLELELKGHMLQIQSFKHRKRTKSQLVQYFLKCRHEFLTYIYQIKYCAPWEDVEYIRQQIETSYHYYNSLIKLALCLEDVNKKNPQTLSSDVIKMLNSAVSIKGFLLSGCDDEENDHLDFDADSSAIIRMIDVDLMEGHASIPSFDWNIAIKERVSGNACSSKSTANIAISSTTVDGGGSLSSQTTVGVSTSPVACDNSPEVVTILPKDPDANNPILTSAASSDDSKLDEKVTYSSSSTSSKSFNLVRDNGDIDKSGQISFLSSDDKSVDRHLHSYEEKRWGNSNDSIQAGPHGLSGKYISFLRGIFEGTVNTVDYDEVVYVWRRLGGIVKSTKGSHRVLIDKNGKKVNIGFYEPHGFLKERKFGKGCFKWLRKIFEAMGVTINDLKQ